MSCLAAVRAAVQVSLHLLSQQMAQYHANKCNESVSPIALKKKKILLFFSERVKVCEQKKEKQNNPPPKKSLYAAFKTHCRRMVYLKQKSISKQSTFLKNKMA